MTWQSLAPVGCLLPLIAAERARGRTPLWNGARLTHSPNNTIRHELCHIHCFATQPRWVGCTQHKIKHFSIRTRVGHLPDPTYTEHKHQDSHPNLRRTESLSLYQRRCKPQKSHQDHGRQSHHNPSGKTMRSIITMHLSEVTAPAHPVIQTTGRHGTFPQSHGKHRSAESHSRCVRCETKP